MSFCYFSAVYHFKLYYVESTSALLTLKIKYNPQFHNDNFEFIY